MHTKKLEVCLYAACVCMVKRKKKRKRGEGLPLQESVEDLYVPFPSFAFNLRCS
jgi:hypothetical protein